MLRYRGMAKRDLDLLIPLDALEETVKKLVRVPGDQKLDKAEVRQPKRVRHDPRPESG